MAKHSSSPRGAVTTAYHEPPKVKTTVKKLIQKEADKPVRISGEIVVERGKPARFEHTDYSGEKPVTNVVPMPADFKMPKGKA